MPLNVEKSMQGKEAMRVYESEGQKGTAKQFSQKEMADYLRGIIEKEVPEVRPLNQRYHAYDVLEEGLQKMNENEAAKKVSLFSPSTWVDSFLEKPEMSRKVGQFLFNRGTKPTPLNDTFLRSLILANQGIGRNQ
jgi:hypothetical protein